MEPVIATCALMAFSLIVTGEQSVEADGLFRDMLRSSLAAPSAIAAIEDCGTYCDLLVTYPDGNRYCFVFGATAPTLTRLP